MKRSYKQNCALAHALDRVGERWTLLIVRELMLGPRRYGELLDNLAGIGTNLLSERLKEMEARELVTRRDRRYALTELGRSLEPVVEALARFGLQLDIEDDPQRLTRPEWDAVALRALYSPERDDGLTGSYVLQLDGSPFRIDRTVSGIRIEPGDSEQAVARVTMSKQIARELARGVKSARDALDQGEVEVLGSEKQAASLLRAFALCP